MAFIDEWQRWHDERLEALVVPYGPLSGGTVTASATVGSLVARVPDDAELVRVPYVAAGDHLDLDRLSSRQRRLLEVEGALEHESVDDPVFGLPAGGVEVFRPHHDWVLPARVSDRWSDEPTLTVEIAGVTRTLVLTPQPQGAFHLVLADATRSACFPVRNVHVPAPDDEGWTVLDLNRAVLPLGTLTSRFAVVPAPAANVLDVPITAGEHRTYSGRPAVAAGRARRTG